MLHSKIYYMEFPDGSACAFIGSNNVTSFALRGLNGEAAVLLDGPVGDGEFQKVRDHIAEAQRQSITYDPGMKEALAWWTREFLEGTKAEVKLPYDWTVVRTILVFAETRKPDVPKVGESIYFEIPDGIEQIESLKTEAHLFLFDQLPPDPRMALHNTRAAHSRFTCRIIGAENRRGIAELKADWEVDAGGIPILKRVPRGILRPTTAAGMQQVHAEVKKGEVTPFEYLFDLERKVWDPEYSREETVRDSEANGEGQPIDADDPDDKDRSKGWQLVRGLVPREPAAKGPDAVALERAKPESGSFLLVALRRRLIDRKP